MAYITRPRVSENVATAFGVGAIALTGAATIGCVAFGASGVNLAVNDTFTYCIQEVDASGNPTGPWEIGYGTYSAANTITRTTVMYNSLNTTAAINFATTATKQVFITGSADDLLNNVDVGSVGQEPRIAAPLWIQSTVPALNFRESDFALPSGLWGFLLSGDSFSIRKNSAVAGDFSTGVTPLSINPTTQAVTLAGTGNATLNIPNGGATAVVFVSSFLTPNYQWRETDQALPAGLWAAQVSGDVWSLVKNSAVAGDFSTVTTPLSIAVTGVVTLQNHLILNPPTAGSVSISLGHQGGLGATTPFVDFHAGATLVDYDCRIIATAGVGTIGGGTWDLIAANTNIKGPGNVTIANFQTTGTQFSTSIQVATASPAVNWRETDQVLPAGMWRGFLNADVWSLQRNTAAAGDFSSLVTPMSVSNLVVGFSLPLELLDQPAKPATPAADRVLIYGQDYAGVSLLETLDASGVDQPLDRALWSTEVCWIRPASGAVMSSLGCAPVTSGTLSTPVLATTNRKTQIIRTVFTSTATAGVVAGLATNALRLWRGNAAGLGGFFIAQVVSLDTLAAGNRGFFGIRNAAGMATNFDPLAGTQVAKAGYAFNANTGNWSIMHAANNAAPTVVSLGASFPINNTDVLMFMLRAYPNGTGIFYRAVNLNTGAVAQGQLTTNLPDNNMFYDITAWMTNNATAAVVAFSHMMTEYAAPW